MEAVRVLLIVAASLGGVALGLTLLPDRRPRLTSLVSATAGVSALTALILFMTNVDGKSLSHDLRDAASRDDTSLTKLIENIDNVNVEELRKMCVQGGVGPEPTLYPPGCKVLLSLPQTTAISIIDAIEKDRPTAVKILSYLDTWFKEMGPNTRPGLGASFYFVISGIVLFAVASVLGATVRRPMKYAA